MHNLKKTDYHDYVIKDGQLVGDFEGLYSNFEDPWNQSSDDVITNSRRMLSVAWCSRIREKFGSNRVLEIGCGFGHLSRLLQKKNFSYVGVDISKTAICKARQLNESAVFIETGIDQFNKITQFDPDILILSEITWYVLDEIDAFIKNIRNYRSERGRPVFIIHLLQTYAPGVQKYGSEKFTNLSEILDYFKFNYLESGLIQTVNEDDSISQGTFFIAEV
jgi:SAM-dependent methyltransferase